MKIRGILTLIFFGLAMVSDNGLARDEKGSAIEDLLVGKDEIPGWSIEDPGWTADNMEELTSYINGAAEVYLRHGFVKAAHQPYCGSIEDRDSRLELSVYDQGGVQNALDLYGDPGLGFSEPIDWSGAGSAARYNRYGGLSQALSFCHGRYLVLLQVDEDTDVSLDILKRFASIVDRKIGSLAD